MKLPTLPRRLFRRRPKKFRYPPAGIPRQIAFEIRVRDTQEVMDYWRREHG
ncbi:hypothetical protein SEA_JEEVES_43 [Mycobacterium phage Jeeves]|uniref:Uncharacterized protein n=1 Tax=Mycobacterium phage Jeeves TaxID=2652402 RepID=A0A5J6T2W6_9CAUD|nr:hypothetical protein KNU75_gp066 [Mycobacterium phage Jeeves]QFG04518.1 hypothetical protein SEA_JEEVES_43 [Mycobacterium phage Jeeves]